MNPQAAESEPTENGYGSNLCKSVRDGHEEKLKKNQLRACKGFDNWYTSLVELRVKQLARQITNFDK